MWLVGPDAVVGANGRRLPVRAEGRCAGCERAFDETNVHG
jgi:hypothetical protein